MAWRRFEFLRNDTLDARGYFLATNQPKNKLRRNQFGGVLSGPIRRDQTFFLVNYEGRRERRGTPSRATVPTLAMRNGDLSEILQPGNRWYPTRCKSGCHPSDSPSRFRRSVSEQRYPEQPAESRFLEHFDLERRISPSGRRLYAAPEFRRTGPGGRFNVELRGD